MFHRAAPDRLALGARDRSGPHDGLLPLLAAVIACGFLVLSSILLWRHATAAESAPARLSAALLVLLMALVQLWIARLIGQRHRLPRREPDAISAGVMLRSLLVGIVLAYVAALVIGPLPFIPYVFIAGIAGWQTLILLPLANPGSRRITKRVAACCAARRCGWLTYGVLLTLVGAELSLRAYSWITGDRLAASCVAHALTLTPGSEFHGRRVNSQGFCGAEFLREPRPGRFRVAILGGGVALSGTAQTNCLVQLEQLIPGLEVYNFGVPQAGPRECAAVLAEEVFAYRPDLVLTFVSVGDLALEPASPGVFDCQCIRLVQLARRCLSAKVSTAADAVSPSVASVDQAYLRQCERRLAICRTPVDPATQRRWQAALAQLDDVVTQCRDRQVPLAMVIVPNECQVNPLLCDAVRRRLGYELADLDLESPQRRLAGFAEDRQLPVLDLLPCLKHSEGSPHVACDSQWNDEGNTLAAQAMSRWLSGRFGGQIAAMAQASAR